MSLPVAFVRITAAIFVFYGVGFIVAPETMSLNVTGTVPATPNALIDMRATYGGMSLAVGVLLFVLAANPALVRSGLMGVAMLMAGMAGGRAWGMIADGSASATMVIYLAFEVTIAALALWLLARQERHRPS